MGFSNGEQVRYLLGLPRRDQLFASGRQDLLLVGFDPGELLIPPCYLPIVSSHAGLKAGLAVTCDQARQRRIDAYISCRQDLLNQAGIHLPGSPAPVVPACPEKLLQLTREPEVGVCLPLELRGLRRRWKEARAGDLFVHGLCRGANRGELERRNPEGPCIPQHLPVLPFGGLRNRRRIRFGVLRLYEPPASDGEDEHTGDGRENLGERGFTQVLTLPCRKQMPAFRQSFLRQGGIHRTDDAGGSGPEGPFQSPQILKSDELSSQRLREQRLISARRHVCR